MGRLRSNTPKVRFSPLPNRGRQYLRSEILAETGRKPAGLAQTLKPSRDRKGAVASTPRSLPSSAKQLHLVPARPGQGALGSWWCR